jgi:hypothetical protein
MKSRRNNSLDRKNYVKPTTDMVTVRDKRRLINSRVRETCHI